MTDETPAEGEPEPRSEPRSDATSEAPSEGSALQPASEGPKQGFELYLLRHADAGDPAEWAGDDADRPLSKKGRRQARQLGAYLKDLKIKPGAIITSPKVRSADTAKLVGKRLGAKVTSDKRLASAFESAQLEDILAGLDPSVSCAVLVGHDPDFSSLLSWLVGAPLALRKGAIARADLADRTVGPGRGSLRWLLPPDAIPG